MAEVRARHGVILAELNIGGGQGVPYASGNQESDLDALSDFIDDALDASCANERFPRPTIVIEQGRANYIRMWDEIYYRPLSKTSEILDIQACFQVAHGSYKRREAMLWQKISPANDYATLVRLLTTDIAPEHRGPGTYMFDALKYRDQWQSRLLRTSAWSPLYRRPR